MRIVSGFLKGKKINFLKSTTTRPLRDFVKENIFNIINHSKLINITLENANVLDLYSGVGSFGVECISRGAKKVTFIENDNSALFLLKKNISYFKIENRIEIFETKIINFLNQSHKKTKFDIVFLDPPFLEDFYINDLLIIKNSNILSKKHLIIIHRDKKSRDQFSNTINVLLTKTYGRSKIIFGILA